MYDYICTICNYTFEDPSSEYNIYKGCPYCGGNVERLHYCEECKKPVPDSLYEYHRCQDCKDRTLQKFRRFLRGLTLGEMHYLEDYTDGRWWKDILAGKDTALCKSGNRLVFAASEDPPVATATVQRIRDLQIKRKFL